jgi:OFA family oxalate/formate antiporter-like MFS transporter
MIKDSGFQATFLYFGLGQGIVIILLAFLLVAPKAGQVPGVIQTATIFQTRRNYGPAEVIPSAGVLADVSDVRARRCRRINGNR